MSSRWKHNSLNKSRSHWILVSVGVWSKREPGRPGRQSKFSVKVIICKLNLG